MAKGLKYPVGTRVLISPLDDCWEKKIPEGIVMAVIPRYRIVRWDRSAGWYQSKVEAVPLRKIIPDTPRIKELAAKYAKIYEELTNSNEEAHKRIRANGKAFKRELTRALKERFSSDVVDNIGNEIQYSPRKGRDENIKGDLAKNK